MNTRKRQAAEPLLPLHSAKQPRTTMVGHDGGNPSPSQNVGLLSRWISFGKELGNLTVDTLTAVFIQPPPRPEPPMLPVHSSDEMPQQHDDQANFRRVASTSASPIQQKRASYNSQPSPTQPDTPPHRRTNTLSPLKAPPALPPTPSSSTGPIGNGIPRIHAALSSSSKSRDGVIPRNYRNREHIFAKAHKANVQAENQRNREEMQRSMYAIRRNHGFTSNFSDFQSLLAFQAQLEKVDQQNALSPSSSMTDLHVREKTPLESRRHSISDNDDMAFLRRAFDRARATLNEPRPPQPFQPSLDQLRLSQRAKDEGIEQLLRPKRVPPTPLPPEADAQVNALLNKRGVVSKFARESVNDQDLSRLKPGQWLNDEIVNFYGAMILGRSEGCKENPGKGGANGKKALNVHYFSTFFWSKLKEGYEKSRLAKWTKKIDIFSKDVILIPVNHSNAHWTGAAINFRLKRIESYDSMGMRRDVVFQLLRSYLDSEHRNKKKKPFDFTGWVDHSMEEPLQENGYDCGVFTCQFLQGLSRGDEFVNFTQKDMPYLRRRMIWEICHATLRDDP